MEVKEPQSGYNFLLGTDLVTAKNIQTLKKNQLNLKKKIKNISFK